MTRTITVCLVVGSLLSWTARAQEKPAAGAAAEPLKAPQPAPAAAPGHATASAHPAAEWPIVFPVPVWEEPYAYPVHGNWLLLRTLRLYPDMPSSVRIRTLCDEMLAPEKFAGELAYLDRAYTGGFERPYGWAWLLMLNAEAQRHEATSAEHLAPYADRLCRMSGAEEANGTNLSQPAPEAAA